MSKLEKTCLCGNKLDRRDYKVHDGFKEIKCPCGITNIDCSDCLITPFGLMGRALLHILMWSAFGAYVMWGC